MALFMMITDGSDTESHSQISIRLHSDSNSVSSVSITASWSSLRVLIAEKEFPSAFDSGFDSCSCDAELPALLSMKSAEVETAGYEFLKYLKCSGGVDRSFSMLLTCSIFRHASDAEMRLAFGIFDGGGGIVKIEMRLLEEE